MGVVLDLDRVGVRRGTAWILSDLTWRVEDDQRWVLLGPNGAGKSTLLSIAATRQHPTTGSARILGETMGMSDVFDLRPRIGLVGAGLSESISARERVRDVVLTASWGMTGRWREEYDAADARRADRLLNLLGVADLAERRFGTLSDGERKRSLIARALMSDPELLLLDEPAAGLDLGGREQLVGRLSAMALDPTAPTTVLVTHHVEEIPLGVTHALLLRDGRSIAQGPVEAVLVNEALSAAYGLPLEVQRRDGRWAARAL
ncbi:MAG: ABC transporter ATP-binding protein [Candidatus Nanopelagicales bacterium]